MKIKTVDFGGVPIKIPDEPWFFWIHDKFDGFPSCCGPGENGHLAEVIVPDVISHLPFSVACWPHDLMFQYGRGVAEFDQANRTLLENMWSINDVLGGDIKSKFRRIPMIVAFYLAVSSPAGFYCFSRSKPRV